MFIEKFRELIVNPFDVKFNCFSINQILEYPHAANDVIHCTDRNGMHFIVKFSRHAEADFENELIFLNILADYDIKVPKVIESGNHNGVDFIVLEYIEGKRISQIIDSYEENKKKYCELFGKNIALIHSFKIGEREAKIRRFHNPVDNKDKDDFISDINNWLEKNKPYESEKCFVHGDHHYANIIWKNDEISGVVDWELAGMGNREFDLAWAIFLRPSQTFFNTEEEEYDILNAYSSLNSFDYNSYNFFKVQIMSHFYTFKQKDLNYLNWLKKNINKIIQN